jgi:hypothetical protein
MLAQDLYYVLTLPIRILKEITFDVYLLTDKTKRIIYITSISMGVDRYIIERLCGDDVKITRIKRIYAWELKKFTKGQDTVLIDMYKYFTRFFDDGFLIPSLVNQVLDIDKPIDDAIKIDKNNLKRIRKYNYEISNDHEDLKFFYEKMYVPYAKIRYGDYAHIESFNNIEKIFKNGGLIIFVTLDGKRVSADLDQMIDDTYFLRKGGILDDSFIKKGALVAAYYFSILMAKEKNAKIVDLGRSRPFLLDGVLRHKNHWGSRICEDTKIKRFIYLKNVLFEQPFIYIDGEDLKVAIFSEDDKLIKEYAESGLEFNIISKGQKQKEL